MYGDPIGAVSNRLSQACMSPSKQAWARASSAGSSPRPVGCCVAGGMPGGVITGDVVAGTGAVVATTLPVVPGSSVVVDVAVPPAKASTHHVPVPSGWRPAQVSP